MVEIVVETIAESIEITEVSPWLGVRWPQAANPVSKASKKSLEIQASGDF